MHAVADAAVIVFGFNDGEGNVRLVIKNVVGELGLAAGDEFAADDDSALGEVDLLPNLQQLIPSRLSHGRRNELGTDVTLAERFFVEFGHITRKTLA